MVKSRKRRLNAKNASQKPASVPAKIWHFLWHDDSAASWIANVILAFVLIRFIFYPVLAAVLGTSFPIVAVLSESMEHGLHEDTLCGQEFAEFPESFDSYWSVCGYWYEDQGISKEQFSNFRFRNGFNKGDLIVLYRANTQNLQVGDVLVFQGPRPQPIIHRIVRIWQEDGQTYYQTKGDHNQDSFSGSLGETKISEQRILGQGIIRIPYLGWVKLSFVQLLAYLGFSVSI